MRKPWREDQGKFQTLADARKEFDRNYLYRVMNMVGGDLRHATEISGCDREELKQLLAENKIDLDDFRKPLEDETASEEGDGIQMV